MFKKILVAYDRSDTAAKAFDTALELAAKFGAQILVLAVARPPEPATRVELDAVLDDAKEQFEEAFVKLRADAAGKGVSVRTETIVGHPAQQIVLRAESEKIDLVVVGHRGLRIVQRWMLGSVSDHVVRYASCPVLVVR
jgi:nucleotide-binding universal stress UspA family protein